ncbi:conjugative transfer system coupling protein TraD [Piscinibacter gummiphilus]|uniref:Conjugative transfer system coupling protein TraD n=1 Tax=Piscinibacter gummiphilus TaxID=946333 RepID=A0ABZ0D701_9BURK|nr:conjugative transfer system coupling protein TraD [Piscinibacter gummiphilus]WOB11145.1 conjugative transfer system coupling protein TraD [Piscinibacter gummiphilus]
MSLTRPYEMPWRPAYEAYASAGWAAGVVAMVAFWASGTIAAPVGPLFVGASACMTWMRTRQALKVLTVRASLSGRAMQVMTTKKFEKYTRDLDQMFLGFGFEWQPVHSQRLYELSKVNYKDFAVSPKLLSFLGYTVDPQPDKEAGLPYIHGVEPREVPLYRPLQNFEGGTLLVGTTQAGKGVALATILTQAIRRGDVVIFIDPKNSKRLKRVVKRACRDYREKDTFLEFHPAFPEVGVRLDFTFNWQKPTEIASRLQSIMPADTAGAFSAFGWDAVNVVVQGLVNLEDRPNLLKLTKYIEGGIEPVLEASLERFFDTKLGKGWRETDQMRALVAAAKRGTIKKPSEAATEQLLAFVEYYEKHIPLAQHDKVIDSMVRTFRHNREHYQKITANLLPILSMLTSGDLGKSLSPDPFDADDHRPIMNFEKIERGGHVLYMCLDSMPDPSVASAIGALALADLSARAGMRYNLGTKGRITLVVDEVSNVINLPLIEILNKGAEGGIYSVCAMQTLADLADRLKSEAAARKALGNLNNLIALRSKDRLTQDFIVETFGKTGIHTMRIGLNQGADTHLGDFSAGSSAQISESMEELIPADILGKLPNLQYFASVSGGRLLKGRFPILDPSFDQTEEEMEA